MVAVALGKEIIVNATTSGIQYRPTITKLASGGFTIAWQDASGLGSADLSDDIRFARFDGFGNRLTGGVDTLANTTTASAQFDPSIAAGDNGKFVVAWSDSSGTTPDFNNRAVRFQIFNSDGTKSGTEKIANTTYPLSQDEPSVAVLSGGNIVVTWTSEIVADSSATNIVRRVFDSSGSPLTGEQTVNTQTVGDQDHSTVHALSTGGFAVVWQDREDSAATSFQTKTLVRFYNSSGTALGNPFVANEASASDPQEIGFAELTDGRIVLTWTEPNTAAPGDGSGSSIRARIYNPANGTFATAVTANTTTSNDQEDAQVAALDNGQFVIAWTDRSTSGGDTSFTAVRMQIFNSNGAKVGGEVLVNAQSTFEQENPVITVLDDFRFVVSWQDNSQTGSDIEGFSIHSRIFDARITGITLDGDTADNSYQGSNFGDTIKGLGGNDKIRGGGGIDFLFGGIGLDLLDGGTGNDTMEGGDGNDTYYVDNAGDVIVEGPGQGTADQVLTSVTYTLGAAAQIEIFTTTNAAGTGAINLNGNQFVQTIYGNAGANIIDGKGGADSMLGLGGDDRYYVDNVNDLITEAAGGGADRVYVMDNYTLRTGVEVENMIARDAAATTAVYLYGNEYVQRITGNAGANILDGKGGADNMLGLGGDDRYYVDNPGDIVQEAAGGGANDRVYTSASYTLTAGSEIETFLARDASATTVMTLTGNTFGQRITGNAGLNVINGKAGADILIGLGGADNFIFDTALGAANIDTIQDFSHADDTIRLDDAIFTGLTAGAYITANQFHIGAAASDAFDRIIYNNATGALLFDADGFGGGGAKQFAQLAAGLAMASNDFYVI